MSEQQEQPFPTRGSGEPGEGTDDPTTGRELDEGLMAGDEAGEGRRFDTERVAEGAGVPFVDARDPGDPGAPVESVGTGGGAGAGPGARYQGSAGGEGAKVAGLRERGQDLAEGEESATAGGPAPAKSPE